MFFEWFNSYVTAYISNKNDWIIAKFGLCSIVLVILGSSINRKHAQLDIPKLYIDELVGKIQNGFDSLSGV